MKSIFTIISIFFSIALFGQATSYYNVGIGGGGAMFSPSISPFNSNELYLVCDMAGVYHSTSAGANWTMIHNDQLISTNRAKVQYTSSPNVLYNIREEKGSFNHYPVKSTDGGNTWTSTTDPDPYDEYYLFANPNKTTEVLAATYEKLYFSNNGGSSWSLVYTDPDAYLHVAGAFWEGNNIYVGTSEGLLVSTNSGASFNIGNMSGFPSNGGIFSFAAAKQGSVTRLFAIAVKASALTTDVETYNLSNSDILGLYKIDYGSGIWMKKETGIPSSHVPLLVDMATNNANIVYAVAETSDGLPLVYKTTNGGNQWNNTFLNANNQNINIGWMGDDAYGSWYWGGSAVAIDVSDTDPNTVATTDFGGCYITQNGGSDWRQMYVDPAYEVPAGQTPNPTAPFASSGLNVTSVHWVHWKNQSEIFLAESDIGLIYSSDGGTAWSFERNNYADDNYYTLLEHPSNGILYTATSDVNDIYQEYRIDDADLDVGIGRILYSSNNGLSWNVLHDFNRPVVHLAMDPNNSNVMYASVVNSSSGGIYKTTNLNAGSGATWTKLPNPPRTQGHPFVIEVLDNGDVVASFSARETNSGNLTNSSGVFYSSNGGNSWQDRSDNDMMYYTKEVYIDPNDNTQSTWYATVWEGFGNIPSNLGGLYKTTNKGLSWTKIFSQDYPQGIVIHPNNPSAMYLATDMNGLFHSSNINSGSPSFTQVNEYPFSRPYRLFFNPNVSGELWVTTYGGSVWIGQDDDMGGGGGSGGNVCEDFEADLNSTNTSCYGSNDGEATAMAFGGLAPYTYQWSTGATTSSIYNLASGQYLVTIMDANDCELIEAVFVDQPAMIDLDLDTQNESYPGANDGYASVTISGGTPNYDVVWYKNGNFYAAGTTFISNLGAANYKVEVMDNNSCQEMQNFTIASGGNPGNGNTVRFTLTSIQGAQDDLVLIPITVDNFTEVSGLQFTITLDDLGTAEFVGVTDFNLPELNNNNFDVMNDQITLGWLPFNVPTVTLDDGEAIFSIEVLLKGSNGACANIEFSDDPVPMEVIQGANGSAGYANTETENAEVCLMSYLSVSGGIQTEDGEAVSGVLVDCTTALPFTTDQDGFYVFPDLMPNSQYQIEPFKNDNHANGVTSFDLVLMVRHITGSQLLNSPYKMIAADVNNTGTITVFDAIITRDLVLNGITQFQDVPSWKFVPTNHQFNNPQDPWSTSFPEKLFVDLNNHQFGKDFIAIKMGDVNLNAQTNLQSSEDRSVGTFEFGIEKEVIGNELVMNFVAKDFEQIASFQMELDFDERTMNFSGIEAGALANFGTNNLNLRKVEEGKLPMVWYEGSGDLAGLTLEDGAVLFSITFDLLQNSSTENIPLPKLAQGVAPFVFKNGGEALDIQFEEIQKETPSNKVVLHQNVPNPFSTFTTIQFSLPKAEDITLEIQHLSGKVIQTIHKSLNEGNHRIELSGEVFPAAGVYLYQLTAGEVQEVRKLVVQK